MLGLTKTRRQADMRKSGPSGKKTGSVLRRASIPEERTKENRIDGAPEKEERLPIYRRHGRMHHAGGPRRRFATLQRNREEVMERTRREQGGSKERARKEHGEDTERARESKERARKGHGKGTERARRKHGESKEGAQRGHGKATKDRERVKRRPGAPQKSRLEGGKNRLEGGGRTGWRGGEVPIEVHEHKKTGALIGRRYVAR